MERSTVIANGLQAAILLGAFGALTTAILWPQLGSGGMLVSLAGALVIVLLVMRLPPALLMLIYGARPYEAGDLAQFDRITGELARRAGLASSPRLYVVPSMQLSAFSFGTSQRFAIAVTEGLLRRLTMREVAGILAREVAHARRGDLPLFGVADFVSRCAQGFYYAGLFFAALNALRAIGRAEPVPWGSVVLLIAAPLLMSLLQLALSRSREVAVDRAAALLTGDPLGLASAIARLDATPGNPLDDLLPPVPARKVPLPSMLRFPPPAERRIALLNAFQAPPIPPLDTEEAPRISLVGVGPIEMRPRYRLSGVWF
ncbi:MAG TPA: zinc metalloprotease HtpX [Hyphomicrobium sp.]|nr:zinc metalloprotease HtpX [Hyphomicrobium sp.]